MSDMSPQFERPDFSTLRHLSKIGLRSRIAVEGALSGIHKSHSMGQNVEFADFREYVKGDDIRNIDWKVYARTDRLYIRQFEEETSMRVYLVLDQSRSMSYGSGGTTKIEYASVLASSLAYMFVRQLDSVGLITFDETIREYIPTGSSPTHLVRLWSALEKVEASKKTEVPRNLRNLAAQISRRGLVILISDLFDEADDIIKGLGYFHGKKFEVVVFQVLDPAELEFPFEGNVIFKDMEIGSEVTTSCRAVKDIYLERMGAFLESVRRGCFQASIDYHLFNTRDPVGKSLMKYLSMRLRRA